MCQEPEMLPNGKLRACRKCSLCKRNHIRDWAGRCIAESKSTPFSYKVELTYGRDEYGDSGHIRAAVLTYSDAQKWLKRIRKQYGKFKYFIAGEYGKERGRAHWHVLLFMQREIEGVKFDTEKYTHPSWKHGFSFWNPFQERYAYYVVKYVHKDKDDDINIAMHQMSRFPPLGHEYFKRFAELHVQNGLSPQHLFYTFEHQKDMDGKPIKFMMRNKTAQNFVGHFVKTWSLTRPNQHIPASPVIEKYLDKFMTDTKLRQEFIDVTVIQEKMMEEKKRLKEEYGQETLADEERIIIWDENYRPHYVDTRPLRKNKWGEAVVYPHAEPCWPVYPDIPF